MHKCINVVNIYIAMSCSSTPLWSTRCHLGAKISLFLCAFLHSTLVNSTANCEATLACWSRSFLPLPEPTSPSSCPSQLPRHPAQANSPVIFEATLVCFFLSFWALPELTHPSSARQLQFVSQWVFPWWYQRGSVSKAHRGSWSAPRLVHPPHLSPPKH